MRAFLTLIFLIRPIGALRMLGLSATAPLFWIAYGALVTLNAVLLLLSPQPMWPGIASRKSRARLHKRITSVRMLMESIRYRASSIT
jgi:hypothetical protein